MTLIRITGSMLRAARSLAGLSEQEVADRAAISRPCLTAWEGSYLLAHDDKVQRPSTLTAKAVLVSTEVIAAKVRDVARRG